MVVRATFDQTFALQRFCLLLVFIFAIPISLASSFVASNDMSKGASVVVVVAVAVVVVVSVAVLLLLLIRKQARKYLDSSRSKMSLF